jgi:hypothetical protein
MEFVIVQKLSPRHQATEVATAPPEVDLKSPRVDLSSRNCGAIRRGCEQACVGPHFHT